MVAPATTDRNVSINGLRLAITEAGVGGRPLLLLHGFTGSRTDFEHWIVPLAELGFHVVAPDLRGHGESEKPASESAYSFDRFAADAIDLADLLGWETFALLGHSMGGMIVQRLVIDHPDRVERLVLMDTGNAGLAIDPALRDAGIEVARTHGTAGIADLTAGQPGPLDNAAYTRLCVRDPAHAARGERNLRAASGAMYAAMLLAIAERPDHCAELAATVVCPTLVVVGELDEPFIDPSHLLTEAISGATLAVIDGGGHSPQFEAPDEWWADVSSFLRSADD